LKVFDLDLIDTHYYIKRNSIVEQIVFNNRTFYAKFERINEPLTPLLLEQHLKCEFTIAAPLLEKGYTDYLVIEYKGEEHQRFHHLIKHLFATLEIENYHIYQGKSEERLEVFIEVDRLSLEEADRRLRELSEMLKQKLTKKWKCLPDSSLPEAYNIVTLPYKAL
jgi:L-rhamnose mutarotase